MSKRRQLERHLHGLDEIRDIMTAMKNLALMETHKLTRVLSTQQRVVATIRASAADFLSFYPDLAPSDGDAHELHVVIGSERGFCGDFNEALLPEAAAREAPSKAALVVVGSRLGAKLSDDSRIVARVAGPTVLEEVQAVLLGLMQTLHAWQEAQPVARPLRLTVFHHRPERSEVAISPLRLFSERLRPGPCVSHPPLLNLQPSAFLTALAEQYLFAVLHEIFYSSLMAENRRRMQHMEAAVGHLERQSQELWRKRNVLRQEEITEEIEVIMLSVGVPR